jgi:hypothetical protein
MASATALVSLPKAAEESEKIEGRRDPMLDIAMEGRRDPKSRLLRKEGRLGSFSLEDLECRRAPRLGNELQ